MAITVLVVDDHAVVRDGLRAILEHEPDIGVVGSAGNGREAVREARRLQPHVVLMDIEMPEMSGIDAAAQIREHCSATRVIILSMYSSVEHVFRALQAGARGYLVKSSAGSEVADAVRAVHAGRRYLSNEISEAVVDGYVREHRPTSPVESLSPRELEVLKLVAEGRTSAEIAQRLELSPKTVESYRGRLMLKLGVDDLPALVKFAVRHGLTTPE